MIHDDPKRVMHYQRISQCLRAHGVENVALCRDLTKLTYIPAKRPRSKPAPAGDPRTEIIRWLETRSLRPVMRGDQVRRDYAVVCADALLLRLRRHLRVPQKMTPTKPTRSL